MRKESIFSLQLLVAKNKKNDLSRRQKTRFNLDNFEKIQKLEKKKKKKEV